MDVGIIGQRAGQRQEDFQVDEEAFTAAGGKEEGPGNPGGRR